MVPLYSVFIAEEKKTKFILNIFSWSILNDCYAFIRAYESNSKWVGSDEMLEFVLSFMDISVIANFRQYIQTSIRVLLLLRRIWKLWGYSNQGQFLWPKTVCVSDENS